MPEDDPRSRHIWPTPGGALYVEPNPDGTRKLCDNCIMWVRTADQCVIHSKDTEVKKSMVCGYHVYGKPMDKWMDHPDIVPVEPKYSGLEEVGEGTSCDNCYHYHEDKCYAIAPKDGETPPVPVDDLGCCALWIRKEIMDNKSAAYLLGVDLGEKVARDMPSFTEQKRPEKAKDIYRALPKSMPTAVKARVAGRHGKPGKQHRGAPYTAPLSAPKKG